jgi:hypothetical protein
MRMGWKSSWTAAAVCLAACAPAPRPGAVPRAPVDALLPSGRAVFAFDFARARYQKAALPTGPADSLGTCRLIDSLRAGFPRPDRWLALTAPNRPFAPMQAAWGPSGNFYLLDRAGRRLSLYDSNAQFLSGIPLPAEIRDRDLDAFQVFWTRDGSFSFVDLGGGVVRQYAELRTAGGQGDWSLRRTLRLPVGTGTCVWEPYLRNPCCLEAAGQAVCFDAYFNAAGPWTPERAGTSGADGIRVRPDPEGRDWLLILDGGPGCSAPPACFAPGKGTLPNCPQGSAPAPHQ